jgi:hypothetical protein
VDADLEEAGPLLDDGEDLVEEPGIDLRPGRQHVDGDPAPQGGLELEGTIRGADGRPAQQLLVVEVVEHRLRGVAREAQASVLEAAHGLLEALGEGAPDRHGLPHRLHRCAEHPGRPWELLERPTRHLRDHVVDGGLEARGSRLGDVVRDLVERVADRELGGDLGDREAGCLRGERRRARDAGVHLDDDHVAVGGIEGELDVGAAGLHTDAADAGERGVAHPLVLHVAQRLRRRNRDRVAGVHAHRVEVLDRADDHAVVRSVAHDLELVLLPPGDRALDEDLVHGAGVEAVARDSLEGLGCSGDPGALAAQDEGGPDDDGEADLLDDLASVLHGVGDPRRRHLQADALHRTLEELPILGGADGLAVGADQLWRAGHADRATFDELHGEVECGLAAEGGEHRVGVLPFDDPAEDVGVERFDVGRVGELGVRHDRGRVRVGQDHAVALLPEDLARLRPRVVELAGLPDDDGPGADEEDRLQVGPLGHYATPRSASG